MADEQNTQPQTEGEGTNQTQPAGESGGGKTFTQEDVDRIVGERLKRAKSSVPDDYEALKAKAAKYDEIEDANKTELEKVQEQLGAITAERDQLKHAEEQRLWASEVAAETKVPASVLRGSTKEEMEAHAQSILASGLSAYGRVPDGGEPPKPATTKDSILAIPNKQERLKQIKAHIELFQ